MPCFMPVDFGLFMISVTRPGLGAVSLDVVKRSWPFGAALSLRISPRRAAGIRMATRVGLAVVVEALPLLPPQPAIASAVTAAAGRAATKIGRDMEMPPAAGDRVRG